MVVVVVDEAILPATPIASSVDRLCRLEVEREDLLVLEVEEPLAVGRRALRARQRLVDQRALAGRDVDR